MSATHRVRGGVRFLWGLSKGIRRGDLFPRAGRQPVAAAPGGSHEDPLHGSILRRIRHEVAWFSTSHHRLAVPGLSRPLRLLQLTDVHLRRTGPWLDGLVEALAAAPPADAVVLTGDIVTRGYQDDAVEQFLSALPPSPLGRFAIMGNWEYWSGAEPTPWGQTLSAHGVQLLVNEARMVGPVRLIGTDDALAGEPDLDAPFSQHAGERPTVVLTHSPALFDRIAQLGVHLVLAGHSHAGQVRLPLLGAGWVPMGTGAFVGGWYQQSGAWMYVSRGVGWSIAPVRVHCPPEFALIELVPA